MSASPWVLFLDSYIFAGGCLGQGSSMYNIHIFITQHLLFFGLNQGYIPPPNPQPTSESICIYWDWVTMDYHFWGMLLQGFLCKIQVLHLLGIEPGPAVENSHPSTLDHSSANTLDNICCIVTQFLFCHLF